MDYNMQLTQAAGALVAEVLGGKLSFKAYPIDHGNTMVWEFGGYPLWPSGKPGKVFVCFPRNTFTMRGNTMKMQPLNQAQCKFFQGDLHTALAHPHIFPSASPCWSQGRYDRVPGFLQVVVETLTLHSTTETSVKKGLCATTLMGVGGGGAAGSPPPEPGGAADSSPPARRAGQRPAGPISLPPLARYT